MAEITTESQLRKLIKYICGYTNYSYGVVADTCSPAA